MKERGITEECNIFLFCGLINLLKISLNRWKLRFLMKTKKFAVDAGNCLAIPVVWIIGGIRDWNLGRTRFWGN